MSERTRDGLAAARSRGRTGGQKPKLTARQAKIARDMYEEKGDDGRQAYTVQQIADEFGVNLGRRTTRFDPADDLPARDHAAEITAAYGYVDFVEAEAEAELARWIDDRAWTTGEGPTALFGGSVRWLRARQWRAGLVERYPVVRRFLPVLCRVIEFGATGDAAPILADQKLWRIDPTADYGPLNTAARGKLDLTRIERHWPDILRIVGSILTGAVSAHDVIRMLAYHGQPTQLGDALSGREPGVGDAGCRGRGRREVPARHRPLGRHPGQAVRRAVAPQRRSDRPDPGSRWSWSSVSGIQSRPVVGMVRYSSFSPEPDRKGFVEVRCRRRLGPAGSGDWRHESRQEHDGEGWQASPPVAHLGQGPGLPVPGTVTVLEKFTPRWLPEYVTVTGFAGQRPLR